VGFHDQIVNAGWLKDESLIGVDVLLSPALLLLWRANENDIG
jgi:hypothetical protein